MGAEDAGEVVVWDGDGKREVGVEGGFAVAMAQKGQSGRGDGALMGGAGLVRFLVDELGYCPIEA